MRKIPLTQNKFALVDDADYEQLSQWKWCYSHGYAMRKNGNKTVYMHKVITGWDRTDHENEDGLDNQRHNLRKSSVAENGRNRGKNKNNSSGFKGVFKQKHCSSFIARIVVNRKPIYLGSYETAIAGAKAYNQAALKYHGEFARLNVI